MSAWEPFWLTFKLAALTTAILLPAGLALGYWLAYGRARWRPIVDIIVTLPLVLPPTVLGFYLLIAFSPDGWLGGWLLSVFNLSLLFSFPGLVLASCLYSLPFMVQPLRSGFEQLPTSLREAAYVLGKSPWQTFRGVLLPNLRPALLTALVLTFAHTVGEFGVVLMIGGNIPGVTRVASIAIYEEVESLNYALAHRYSLVLLLLTIGVLLSTHLLKGQKSNWL
jgi:molybdate transport system permease protein